MKVVAKSVTSKDALIRNISRQIPSRVSPRLNTVGRNSVKYIHAWLDANFERRDNLRRRNTDMDAGFGRLHGSFTYEVINNMTGKGGKLDMSVELSSAANPRLLAIIEKGSKPHNIPRTPNVENKAMWVAFPVPNERLNNATGGSGKIKFVPEVNHKGTDPHSQGRKTPWRIALDRAVKESAR